MKDLSPSWTSINSQSRALRHLADDGGPVGFGAVISDGRPWRLARIIRQLNGGRTTFEERSENGADERQHNHSLERFVHRFSVSFHCTAFLGGRFQAQNAGWMFQSPRRFQMKSGEANAHKNIDHVVVLLCECARRIVVRLCRYFWLALAFPVLRAIEIYIFGYCIYSTVIRSGDIAKSDVEWSCHDTLVACSATDGTRMSPSQRQSNR